MSVALGSFRVKAEPDEAAAFRRATGLDGDRVALPLTFPMRWLVAPEIRAALAAMVPEPDLALVHESQSFDYKRPLRCGESYILSVLARRESSPDRLFVDGTIVGDDGVACASVETILRLFPTRAAA